MSDSDKKVPRILILGAGFGGLYLTLNLARRLRHARMTAEITLLDRQNYFLFSPLLHEVAVEMVEMHHAVHPIRQSLRGMPVRFHETTVTGIDLDDKRVTTTSGDFSYDYLVLALGSVTNYFGLDSVAHHSFSLKALGDAFRLRNHLLTMFELASATRDAEQRRRLLTFVQAGAGFTGIETVAEIHDLIHRSLLRDYPAIHPEDVRLLMVDALPFLQVPSNPRLAAWTLSALRKKGIEVRMDTPVSNAGKGWVEFADGERIATNTLIWTAGITTHPLVAGLPVEHGSQKRVKVHPTLQLLERPDVFALGDCAYLEGDDGKPLPATAQVANQQAPRAADNLLRAMTGKPLQPFHFRCLGELASLGHYSAVADIGGITFLGFPAWWIWRTIYLMKMPWWGERARIAADWTLDLFFPRDTSRIEVGPCPACPLSQCPESLAEPPSGS